jgi:hypothetical protein
MAVFVITDASVTINAVDLSGKVRKATLKISADDQDMTAMGATWQAVLGGIKKGTLSLEFNQDYAAAQVDATLWAAFGLVTTCTIKATSGANSATNPQFSGPMLLKDYTPIDGSTGDAATANADLVIAGALSRLVV